MIGQGVSSFSSHSWAAGRTTSAAKPWTQLRMSFWSWLSASEKVVSLSAEPAIASTAASTASVASVALALATRDVAEADIGWDLLWMTGSGKRGCEGGPLLSVAHARAMRLKTSGFPIQPNPDAISDINAPLVFIRLSMQKVIMPKRTLAVALTLSAVTLGLAACGSSSSGKHLALVA